MPSSQPAHHRVKKTVFDLQFPDEETAFRVRTQLEAMFQHTVVPALEQVFDASGPNETHIEIDRLEIDLGELDPDRFSPFAISELIIAQGTAALTKRFSEWTESGQAGRSPSDNQRRSPGSENPPWDPTIGAPSPESTESRQAGASLAETLSHFLIFGYLPWNSIVTRVV